VAGCRTISKLRILSRHQQLIRADFEDHFPQWDGSSLQRLVSDSLAGSDLLILSDYNKGALRAPSTLIDTTRQAGLPVVVDPKGSDYSRYRGATIVTPNLSEFEAVAGHCSSEDELVRRGYALCDQLELNALLITRSERGMTLLVRGAPPLHLPTRAREVFDVTGAGDTVVATLGAALATGEPLADAVALANIAAGLVVARLGTATVTPQELRDAATPLIPVGAHAILDQPTAVAEVAAARRRGERVVMTNGCFDLLHPGHIDYLTRARALGDRLLVAVNDDSSVQRLKGESRPVNPLESRMAMLAALAAVDWVVPFSEDTPRRLICSIGPDLLVKWGDYRPEEIAGGDCVVAAGGEVRVLDFLPGHSSSAIIQRICEVNR
jgi:D-beta-D-heptose 7-phosphate kinase/D-beta-D-heptose 1-phosphate adenosyltransferase